MGVGQQGSGGDTKTNSTSRRKGKAYLSAAMCCGPGLGGEQWSGSACCWCPPKGLLSSSFRDGRLCSPLALSLAESRSREEMYDSELVCVRMELYYLSIQNGSRQSA